MITINTVQDTDRKDLHNVNEIELGQQHTEPINSCLQLLSQLLQLTQVQLYQLNLPNNRNNLRHQLHHLELSQHHHLFLQVAHLLPLEMQLFQLNPSSTLLKLLELSFSPHQMTLLVLSIIYQTCSALIVSIKLDKSFLN